MKPCRTGRPWSPSASKELRDLAEPEYVYQLTHPALPAPLLARPAEKRPQPSAHFLTSLVQRETDLAEVKALLVSAQQNVRSPFGRTGAAGGAPGGEQGRLGGGAARHGE